MDFTNLNYKVLQCLYDNTGQDGIIRVKQQDVADKLHITRATVNKIYGLLVQHGYVEHDEKKVRSFRITDSGRGVVEIMSKMNASERKTDGYRID